jgi:membrane protein YqaA with SNARE-associated domain
MTADGAVAVAGVMALMLAVGLLSGLLPVLNAEALLIAALTQVQGPWLPLVVAMAVGQSGAKVLIYLSARDGSRVLTSRRRAAAARWVPGLDGRRSRPRRTRPRRWAPHADRVAQLVRRPVAGSALILASAVGGIPPLAATSVMAGLARMRLSLFGATCLTGRLVRFTIIAVPVAGWPHLGS